MQTRIVIPKIIIAIGSTSPKKKLTFEFNRSLTLYTVYVLWELSAAPPHSQRHTHTHSNNPFPCHSCTIQTHTQASTWLCERMSCTRKRAQTRNSCNVLMTIETACVSLPHTYTYSQVAAHEIWNHCCNDFTYTHRLHPHEHATALPLSLTRVSQFPIKW